MMARERLRTARFFGAAAFALASSAASLVAARDGGAAGPDASQSAEESTPSGQADTDSPGTEAPLSTDDEAPGSAPLSTEQLSPEAPLSESSRDLTDTLEEAALDLGIVARVVSAQALDHELARRPPDAAETWILSHQVTPAGDLFRVEVTAVPPGAIVRRVAADIVARDRIEVRAIVLLRDAVQVTVKPVAPTSPPPQSGPPPPRSSGRAVLALNTALLGGAIGVSLHQAGTGEDDRLLYPLAALGVGIGLGASMLIADEWDITTDDAWFLSAGMVWPAVSGVLLATSHDVPREHRYLHGLAGTAAGVTLATVVVANGRVSEGSATLAHSGAAFGLGMGALAEGIIEGDLVSNPIRGMGYGAGAGVLVAGIAAAQVETSSSRVLLVDLSALLGGLTGGALATPLLLVDDVNDARRRLWFGSIALGTAAGALVGALATRDDEGSAAGGAAMELTQAPPLISHWAPQAGIIGFSERATERGIERSPAFGAGVQGLW